MNISSRDIYRYARTFFVPLVNSSIVKFEQTLQTFPKSAHSQRPKTFRSLYNSKMTISFYREYYKCKKTFTVYLIAGSSSEYIRHKNNEDTRYKLLVFSRDQFGDSSVPFNRNFSLETPSIGVTRTNARS